MKLAITLAAVGLGGCAHAAATRVVVRPALQLSCEAEPASAAERHARSLVGILSNDEAQAAQFALDSLRMLGDDARIPLVCALTDDTVLESRAMLYWLNRGEAFELIAHYSPDTVGQAARLLLGGPPGSQECREDTTARLQACQLAWAEYLEKQ